ncbi:MAG TPA: amidophosphoribosyltransferase [Acidimicrobiales bacterium]|nr:amidophosphoribosyltransferase [Acidimicrobiales bacterium]
MNADELKRLVEQQDHRHLNTNSDSEVLLNVFAHELGKHATNGLKPQQILDAVEALYKRCSGGYAVVAMIIGYGIVAFRDPHGIRPLVLGIRETPNGVEHMVASESVALDAVGFELERDVQPGEAVFIDKRGYLHSRQTAARRGYTPCVFEFVYFARPDSRLYGQNVHQARVRMGELLAEQAPVEADMVMGVPESGVPAAEGFAHRSGIPLGQGLVKNRYIGRSFIAPSQELRARAVRMKLNPLRHNIEGKRLVVIDDSIVRGTTQRALVRMLREAGALEVHLRISSPPVMWSCFYGIDTGERSELIAHRMTLEEIRADLDADTLAFLDLDRLIEATGASEEGFCDACFTGHYPVEVPVSLRKHVLESNQLPVAEDVVQPELVPGQVP